MIGFDPVQRPLWTTVARVSGSYTQTAIIDWSWDALIIETEGWERTVLSEGSQYNFSANEIQTWAEVHWSSNIFGEAFGLDLPVTITAKPTVWALPNGAYSCTFWHSEWEGIFSVLGEQLVNVGVLKVCAAQ